MGVIEYREDDLNLGYCPKCGAVLQDLTVGAKGLCPNGDGWVWAEWGAPPEEEEEDE